MHFVSPQALKWLRDGDEKQIESELKILHEAHSTSESQDEDEKSLLVRFREPRVYKPFALLVATFFLQQASGSFAVIFYAVNVFRDLQGRSDDPGVEVNPYIPAIATGLIRCLGTGLGTILLKK